MKIRDVKHLVGKRVEYWMDGDVDHHRGTVHVKHGTVNQIAGRNIEINDSWLWIPNLSHIKELPSNPQKSTPAI